MGGMCAKRIAGMTPNATAVTTVVTRANPSTTGLNPTSSRRGTASPPRRWSTRTPIRATASPISPPRPARNRLSTRSWRKSRVLPAPSAERVANSWTRPVARASTRLATFTHATRSTSPTAINSRRKGPRAGATRSSCSGVASIALKRAVGKRSFITRLRLESSARACSRPVPLRSRATTVNELFCSFVSRARA